MALGDDARHQGQQKKEKKTAPTPERKAALAKDVSELPHGYLRRASSPPAASKSQDQLKVSRLRGDSLP